MVRGFEHAAVYLPRFVVQGRHVAAPDEDPFTLAATALEALGPAGPAGPSTRVCWIGAIPPVAEWGLAALLGGPVDLRRFEDGPLALASAVTDALAAPAEGPSYVIVVPPTGPRGTEAFALRMGPHPASAPPDWAAGGVSEDAASRARAILPVTTVGSHPTAPPWTPEAAEGWAGTATGQVSEGAYVPRARYLENLPSRWRLEADRCAHCAHLTFPRRGTCRGCGRSDRLSVESLPRDGGRVVAATVIGQGGQPTEFDAQVEALGPYGVVLAELAPGVRLTLQVTDAVPGEIQLGSKVGTRLRRLYPMEGEWRYGRKAVPLPT
ncbi:MAG: hypothetical protein L3K10_04075 [Thermoplasmata archaeon]|nr:hypothetical protein [Thermoplasmata archaeon]